MRARKIDSVQPEIVEALRKAGVMVWVIEEPCDLLTLCRGVWLPLEVKTPTSHKDKRQEAQQQFLKDTGTPVVTSALQAIETVISHSRRI